MLQICPNRSPAPVPLALWGVLTALATLLNPRGVGVLGYVRDLLGSSQVTTLVQEWAPPTIVTPMALIFFIFMIGCFLSDRLCTAEATVDRSALLVHFSGWHSVQCAISSGLGLSRPRSCALAVAAILPEPRGRPAQGQGPLNAILVGLLRLCC